jgi:hypothetical protein
MVVSYSMLVKQLMMKKLRYFRRLWFLLQLQWVKHLVRVYSWWHQLIWHVYLPFHSVLWIYLWFFILGKVFIRCGLWFFFLKHFLVHLISHYHFTFFQLTAVKWLFLIKRSFSVIELLLTCTAELLFISTNDL